QAANVAAASSAKMAAPASTFFCGTPRSAAARPTHTPTTTCHADTVPCSTSVISIPISVTRVAALTAMASGAAIIDATKLVLRSFTKSKRKSRLLLASLRMIKTFDYVRSWDQIRSEKGWWHSFDFPDGTHADGVIPIPH